MFMMFDQGRCHFCGEFGKAIDKGVFKCEKCEAIFNKFAFSPYTEIKEFDDKFWQ